MVLPTPKVSAHLSHLPAPLVSQYKQLGVEHAPQAVPVGIGPLFELHLEHSAPIVVQTRQFAPQSAHLGAGSVVNP